MKNREVFQRDPIGAKLLNDGVAAVSEAITPQEMQTLRYELEHFVCEGQYEDGMVRILESYIDHIGSTAQPSAWVSGFYGSGKSHLLKMFRHLWVNTPFPDGATARGLARFPQTVHDLLRELDTLGKRYGGLHAAAGTLPSGGGESVRLTVLSLVMRSKGLPESLPQAQFCMWLQHNGIYNQVRVAVEADGRDFRKELHDLYVSPRLAQAVLEADPSFAPDLRQARAALRSQFPVVDDLPTSEFVRLIPEVLTENGQLPCTVIVLDEVQLFIGDSTTRSTHIQEVEEALSKQCNSRILLIGAGQTALAGNVPLLQRLRGRFTIPVELSDADVETVTWRVVLAKKADKRKAVEDILSTHAGEVDRQLAGTRIGPRAEDHAVIVDDYPLLPVRRRFWEYALRAVDVPGTSSQLRTQLRIVHDAVRHIAEEPLRTVVPADFIFEQLQPDLLRTGVLLREIDETIRNLDDGTSDGKLARRLCGLIFLIRKLPRESVADIGVRATEAMLADLLVSDLSNDGARLRKGIPRLLQKLVDTGKLIKLDDEYSLQTRESSEWDREFRNRVTRWNNDIPTLSNKRSTFIAAACTEALKGIKLLQGNSKELRKLLHHFGTDAPATDGRDIPVWIRDGWGENESTVFNDVRVAGSDSPIIFVYIPRAHADDLQRAIVESEAAQATLDFKGTPTTSEGIEARDAMATRKSTAETTRNQIIREIINQAKVIQGGGSERYELDLVSKVQATVDASLDRLFPRFKDADDNRWNTVITRAKNGDEAALQAVNWSDSPEKHPVCAAILTEVGAGKKGKDIRDTFEASPYGWPRDAIDAALITLFTTGHLRAVHKGTGLSQGQLDQAKIAVTDFRVETITIDARARIKLRKLFQTAGISCKPNEESAKAGEFLACLDGLADRAGGGPPLPVKPDTTHLDGLRTRAGNEQLAAILQQHDTLEQQVQVWDARANLAAKRKPAWETLSQLLKHVSSLSEAEELQHQAEAVYNERRLLEPTDPVPDIRKATVDLLRAAVIAAHSTFQKVYNAQMAAWRATSSWQKLSDDQRRQLLTAEGINIESGISVGNEAELLRTLELIALPMWKIKTDALPQQFANAALAAAKLVEPKTQHVRLTSSTLKTEDDIRDWLVQTEAALLEKLKDGPIVIS
jgi:hypothetical protein